MMWRVMERWCGEITGWLCDMGHKSESCARFRGSTFVVFSVLRALHSDFVWVVVLRQDCYDSFDSDRSVSTTNPIPFMQFYILKMIRDFRPKFVCKNPGFRHFYRFVFYCTKITFTSSGANCNIIRCIIPIISILQPGWLNAIFIPEPACRKGRFVSQLVRFWRFISVLFYIIFQKINP